MENASKALIIAGAILISILLISIGILLVNAGQDVANSGAISMSSQSIQAFNSQFTEYEGSNKSAREVSQLLDTVISSNASHSNQVVVRFYKKWSIMKDKYSDLWNTLPIPSNQDLVLTNDIYFEGLYAAEHGHIIVNINTIKDTVNILKRGKFNVKLCYPSEEDVKSNFNKHLNLSKGCIFFVWIDLI
jgi:hypothetical protein